MRRMVWLIVIGALAWSGWWLFAAQSFQANLAQWFSDRRAEGWQAEYIGIESSGFPLHLETTLHSPLLADPSTGVAFDTDALLFSAPAWWPGHLKLLLPGDELRVASPVEKRVITALDAQADLLLRPGSALELSELALTAGRWTIDAPAGRIAGARALTLRMKQSDNAPTTYDFTLDAPEYEPGSVMRAALGIPAQWPLTFDNLALDARVDFNRPYDRRAIEDARPQPRRIELTRAEAIWGDLMLRSTGDMTVSPEGLLNGELSFQARNWRQILDLAEEAGSLPSGLRPQVDNILAALARGGGNPDALDVTLSFRDGTIFLGFIPIGQLPQIILR